MWPVLAGRSQQHTLNGWKKRQVAAAALWCAWSTWPATPCALRAAATMHATAITTGHVLAALACWKSSRCAVPSALRCAGIAAGTLTAWQEAAARDVAAGVLAKVVPMPAPSPAVLAVGSPAKCGTVSRSSSTPVVHSTAAQRPTATTATCRSCSDACCTSCLCMRCPFVHDIRLKTISATAML